MNTQNIKSYCVNFFYWWIKQPGTNTIQGFDEWWFNFNEPLELGLLPMESAPKDGTYIILFAESGYATTPLRAEICKYDAEYRPLQPWVNHSNDSFRDGGEEPCGWLPLPEVKL